ncbi:matrix-remodeling-associated protein 7 [Ixodes scapularis]|uniref:matrix-remodeling-associated protein 7 n=1 Tax=Ixodes scapularis TaxID=6945 RepID=UPI001C386106|nr:matrix-remodeling-associated protein 7 [Ixodes scapularis]
MCSYLISVIDTKQNSPSLNRRCHGHGMGSIWSSLSPVLVLSIGVSVTAVLITAIFSYRTANSTNVASNTFVGPSAVTSEDESTDDSDDAELQSEGLAERLPAKPLVAMAAESVISAAMTDQQRELEHETQRKQLQEIYRLMQENRDKFGDTSIDEVVNQMALYR